LIKKIEEIILRIGDWEFGIGNWESNPLLSPYLLTSLPPNSLFPSAFSLSPNYSTT